MSVEEQNKALARRYYRELMSEGNLAFVDEFMAPEFEFTNPTHSEPYRGAEFKELVSMLRGAFPDLHFTPEHLVARGDTVVGHWTARGTHTGTPLKTLSGDGARKFRPAQHLGKLGVNRRRKGQNINLLGSQQCSFRNTIGLQCRSDERGSVEDDQRSGSRLRRSALWADSSASTSTSVNPALRTSAFNSAIALARGLGPPCGRSTRLTRRPTASRLRASASAAAASASTGMVTSTVLSISASRGKYITLRAVAATARAATTPPSGRHRRPSRRRSPQTHPPIPDRTSRRPASR